MWSQVRVVAEAPRVGPSRGWYCALLGHPFESLYKKDTYMFVSPTPVLAATLHNRKAVRNKDTRAVAPFWHFLLIVGPFAAEDSALAFGREWIHNTRGSQSKRRRGVELARAYGMSYYAPSTRPGRTLAYLRRHAPPEYVAAFRRLSRPAAAGGQDG